MKLLQPIVDKCQSIIRNRKYKEGDYFALENLNVADEYGIGIRLLSGDYAGVLLSISHLSVMEEMGYRGAKAGFTIKIHESKYPEVNNNLPLPEKLGKIVSDILLIILEHAIKNEYGYTPPTGDLTDEEDRKDYFEEPVPQRTVREKDSAVPEDGVPARPKRKTPVRRNPELRPKV